jgi:hypothetical protein
MRISDTKAKKRVSVRKSCRMRTTCTRQRLLRRLLEVRGIENMRSLARIARVSPDTVYRGLRGSPLREPTAERIAHVLDLDLASLCALLAVRGRRP